MRLRNNAETFYAIPYGIAKDFVQYKSGDFTSTVFTAEQVKEIGAQLIAHTKLSDLTNNVTNYQEAFQYLEIKAEVARKTISFWDAYQVKGILAEGDEDTLESRIAQLPSNSSIIANTRGDWYENGEQQSYYPGDIFIKDYYNRITHLPIISSGYYYPSDISQVDNSNTYAIVYTYASSQPTVPTSTDGSLAKQMTFNLQTTNEQAYNMSYSLNANGSATGTSVSFEEIKKNNGSTDVIVYPVIKAFINNNNILEEQLFNAINITYTAGSGSNEGSFSVTNLSRSNIIITVK